MTLRTTQLYCASTLYGAATLAAGLDAGCFAPADRRILVVLNNTGTPELSTPLDAMPGFEKLRGRFDAVVTYNDVIRPFHPADWTPRGDDQPLWQRYFRNEWDLGDDRVELIVESIQVNPSLAICQIFHGAPIHVYADGLMSYGPTRNKLDQLIGTRIQRLLHLDLVPGLKPLLLDEFGVEAEIIPSEHFLKVLAELAPAEAELGLPEGNPALLLGQYLSALNILTPEEEDQLHLDMVKGAVAQGHTKLVFKPHPSAPVASSAQLRSEAEKLGAELTVIDTPVLAEVVFKEMRPALVVGCFSTALLTAASLYGLPVARTGTELLLERLTPFQNSNRVPVAIVHALLPDVQRATAGQQVLAADEVELRGLIEAMGFAMQPKIYPYLRPAAESYLGRHLGDGSLAYFKRRRLTALGLPGGLPGRLPALSKVPAARRMVRKARALRQKVRR